MSLFRRVLNLDQPESPELPVAPDAPLPTASVGDTGSVKLIAAQLDALPPARARYVAAFAYLLGRAANATGATSDAERAEMVRLAGSAGLGAAQGPLIVDMAATLADEFGATDDFLVAREFKAISTMEERELLLRCCFLVMAADDEIDATESWLVNRLAEELDVERPDLNAIRSEFHEQLSGVKEVRRLAAS
ncbi:MAG TPA: TerB family tellurite resistance protein [Candidatus Limnocylindrales bacterium]|nr:TerB family tellurite resistance protein [Candidatus Limnocylindrales bacterium]